MSPRRIWIDLATPPQVLFFRPIWQALCRAQHPVLISVRDFSGAPALAQRMGMPHVVVGRHGGQSVPGKGAAILRRVGGLTAVARRFRPDLAISHNSYAQSLAARILGIRHITAMDYEHQPANHLSFRLAARILVPEPFPQAALLRFGAGLDRVVRYPGIKEEVYLADFEPNPCLPSQLGLPLDRVVVSVRPPPRLALYHQFENPLFEALLAHVAANPSTYVTLIDRMDADWSRFPSVQVLRTAVDGPSLLWYSDVVIGAGGTMTREAAVLGTPAYNVFGGQPSAVDNHLVERGRMARVSSEADFESVALRKKPTDRAPSRRTDGLNRILAVLQAG
jgi:uncharacterized protein